MKKALLIILAVFVFAGAIGTVWAFITGAVGRDSVQRATVEWIIDGDTFVIEKRVRVRLLGIDAPEASRNAKLKNLAEEGHDADSVIRLGRESTTFCISRYKGKTVRLERDGIQPDKDTYGRLLRYLYLEDGACINEELLREGQAEVYRRHDFTKRDAFFAAEEEARNMHKGVWQE